MRLEVPHSPREKTAKVYEFRPVLSVQCNGLLVLFTNENLLYFKPLLQKAHVILLAFLADLRF